MPFYSSPGYVAPSGYVDVTASRAKNTAYTNNTGKTIFCSVVVQFPASSSIKAALYISGENVNFFQGYANAIELFTFLGFVNPGQTYQINDGDTDLTIVQWFER